MEPQSGQRAPNSDGRPFWVALTGNPNCGKTTVFNALTGLRARVGNYAGVTVERKEGAMLGGPVAPPVMILDLPGTYSLSPQSLDEQIARDILFCRVPDVPKPDCVVVVVDASNLQRNLYYAMQVIELGYPTVLALNMVDVARDIGTEIDAAGLSAALGVPVVPMVASDQQGLPDLRAQLIERAARSRATGTAGTPSQPARSLLELPQRFGEEAAAIEALIVSRLPPRHWVPMAEAVLILGDSLTLSAPDSPYPAEIRQAVADARGRLEASGVDWRSVPIEARYARAAAIQAAVTHETAPPGETMSDRLDRVLTHRIWGLLLFVGIMGLMFQTIFTVAAIPMEWIEAAVDAVAGAVASALPAGDFSDLLTRGVIAGVGSVVVFLPQICLLFMFISLLEDTGYMARAAFLMDRFMSKVGLHGKSFIPMLSSFACAIPGIMATRTIESPKDRLVTMLVAPLMSCSARLPVYTVLIAACIPPVRVLGWIGLPGLVLLGMYLLGTTAALGMAWLFKKTLLRGEPPPLILELPPYKRPVPSVVLRHMWERSKLFVQRAGTVILGINILLWFLVSYPRDASVMAGFQARRAAIQAEAGGANGAASTNKAVASRIAELDHAEAGAKLRASFAGRMGRWLEPVLTPLGFDWQIGIGIVASFAAREVFVSTMSVVYNAGEMDKDSAATSSLADVMRLQKRADGTPVYTILTGLTLMVFYVFAMQCVSTVAVMRRETNGWKWPAFQWAYMTGLAWVAAFLMRQLGMLVGIP